MNSITKTFITNFSSRFTVSSYIKIIYTIFLLCSSNSHGGAIYIGHTSISSILFFCSFEKCSSLNHGGAINIQYSNINSISKCCYFNCSAIVSPGCVIWGDTGGNVDKAEINLTDEFHILSSNYNSLFYTRSFLKINQNNFSNGEYNYCLNIGCDISSNIFNFNQIYNFSKGSILGFNSFTPNKIHEVSNSNFLYINVPINNGWIWFYTSRSSIFNNCIFQYITLTKIIYPNSNVVAYVSFNNCYFSDGYYSSYFNNCNTNDSIFYTFKDLNNFEKLSTILCWKIILIDFYFNINNNFKLNLFLNFFLFK